MGKVYDAIDDGLRSFIEAQHVFFAASAPAAGGHVNLSPKGLDSLRIIDGRTLLYLDYVGSGAETIAHLNDDGRIVLMLCAFDGAPKIVRLHGRGEAIEPQHEQYAELRGLFPSDLPARAVIRVSVERISDSCGFGVPLMEFKAERATLTDYWDQNGEQKVDDYQRKENAKSLDGLPGVSKT